MITSVLPLFTVLHAHDTPKTSVFTTLRAKPGLRGHCGWTCRSFCFFCFLFLSFFVYKHPKLTLRLEPSLSLPHPHSQIARQMTIPENVAKT